MAPTPIERLENRCLLAADFFAADFNSDRHVDSLDIELLQTAVLERAATGNAEATDSQFDLDGSGDINSDDVDFLIEEILHTVIGDLDLDRDVDFTDFLRIANGFDQAGVWSTGDLNTDGVTDFDDFLMFSAHFQMSGTTHTYTSQTASGNRYIEGWGNLPNATRLDLPLRFEPAWVAGVSTSNGNVWYAVSHSGEVQSFLVQGDSFQEQPTKQTLPAGMPPLLATTGSHVELFQPATTSPLSNLTPPTPTGRDSFVAITPAGEFLIQTGVEQQTIAINALPDARISGDGGGRFAVLTDPSTEYPHGVLGDRIEATSVTIVDTRGDENTTQTIPVPAGQVVEGIAPIWADVTGDGEFEILVTLSQASNGGQITAFNMSGAIVAQGPGIERGFRWRHQIAVAPTGNAGEPEIIDVLTPHIGGVVEFRNLQPDNGQRTLPIAAETSGFTSHVIRARNLDMAAVSDFDSDGTLEVVLPNQSRNSLGAITRTDDGSTVDWQIPIGGRMTTNLGIARAIHGRLQVAVGTANQLHVWAM